MWRRPALLLPFAANAARQLDMTVTVIAGQCTAVTNGTAVSCSGNLPTQAERVDIRIGDPIGTVSPTCTRAAPDPAIWALLNSFAHRTYAPATEESRLLGAGAGLSDND